MREANLPKFLMDDMKLFQFILKDNFQDVEIFQDDNSKLLLALKKQCAEMNLVDRDQFIEKVIQLYRILHFRHGIMLLGPTGSGKTENINLLQKTLNYNKKPNANDRVHSYKINPKSITIGQLYGEQCTQQKN